jgi:hypothetical protein
MREIISGCLTGVLTAMLIGVLCVGCSGGGATMGDTAETCVPDGSFDGRACLGYFRMSFDECAGSVAVEPIRGRIPMLHRRAQWDVTDYAEFGITSAEWDPITRDWTIGAYLKNPTHLTGYGVWIVFENLGDKVLRAQDGFTWVVQGGGGMLRVPFVALAKDEPLRRFLPNHTEDITLIIHWPEGVNSWPPVDFYIDAHWPKERKTPMVEEPVSWHEGDDPPVYFITAWVADFQEASSELDVTANLLAIDGGVVDLYDDGLHGDGGANDSTFGCYFESDANKGDYVIRVYAKDPLNHSMENDVWLTIIPIDDDCLDWWELRKGTKCNIDWDTEFLIRSQSEWETFLQQFGPYPNPPVIDWDTEMVAAFTWGEVMSSGYWIEMVDACWDDQDVLHVRFYRWWPGPNCKVAWVIQWPYLVIKVERWAGDVVFDGEFKEDPCKDW